MIPDDLMRQLLGSESDRVEYKRSAGQRDGILEAVGALANDLGGSGEPGYVLIGVGPDGSLSGIEGDLDRIQRDLADRTRSSKIQPVPSVDIELHDVDGRSVIVVRVAPYPTPPVVEVDGIARVRVGSTTRRASNADLVRLNERRPQRSWPFDTRPWPGAGLYDLEIAPLERAWHEARNDDEDPETFPQFEAWLVRQQLGSLADGRWCPNAAALLLHGVRPQDWLPGAWIDLVHYRGRDLDAPVVSRKRATGTLSEQLEAAWAWIEARIDDVPLPPEGMIEGFAPRYPAEALRELARNLVQHRQYEGTHAPGRIEWYEDRIEFSNPGGPFGRASEGEFGSQSDYRNPRLTAGLVHAGYVQQLGRGVQRARLLLQRNGNPDIEVATNGQTRVVVRSRA